MKYKPVDCTVQSRLFLPVALHSLLIYQCEHKPDLLLLKSFKTLKVNSHGTCAFAFFFDLCRPVLENANINCEQDLSYDKNLGEN